VKRRFFNLLAALSLLMCVATVVLWVRSLGRVGAVDWNGAAHSVMLWNGDGFVALDFVNDGKSTFNGEPIPTWHLSSHPMPPGRSRGDLWGYNGKSEPNSWGFAAWCVQSSRPNWRFGGRLAVVVFAPYWFLVLILSLLPTVWLLRTLRRRRRVVVGLCTVCGYDLRATPERCPECGAVPAGAAVCESPTV
jgi:hypothetical protein